MVELAIDTASEMAGVALTAAGELVSELTWRTKQNHSRELLPAVELLLARAGFSKADLTAVFVCIGPGSYAGLRVGLSTAKGLAYALDLPIVGIGRLEADAEAVAAPEGTRIVAVHAAGRADLAWAAYARREGQLLELAAPGLSRREEFLSILKTGDVICGELEGALRGDAIGRGALPAPPMLGRVVAVALHGWRRLEAGSVDSTDALVPLYLREPAIGPQTHTR